MRNVSKVILISLGAALALTILLGFVNVTPQRIVGATWYGWPFAWRYIIVYPGSPENYDFMNFVIDALLWFVPIVAIGALISIRLPRQRK